MLMLWLAASQVETDERLSPEPGSAVVYVWPGQPGLIEVCS